MIPVARRLFTKSRLGWRLTPRLNLSILSAMVAPKKQHRVQGIKVHLDPPLLAWLRLEAKRLDVSISEVLRRLVRKEMGA